MNFGGGGSGGSIFINTEVLTGGHTGSIQVKGGTVPPSLNGGGGAGGRIAAYYNNTIRDAFYNGTFDSEGGSAGSVSEAGASGTVYLKHVANNHSKLIIDNKGGWSMDTEIEAKGYKLEFYDGNSGRSTSYSKGGMTVSSSCSIWYDRYVHNPPNHGLSNLFDQSYRSGYQGYYSHYYIGHCANGQLDINLNRVMLINSVRIFPMQNTHFKVSSPSDFVYEIKPKPLYSL